VRPVASTAQTSPQPAVMGVQAARATKRAPGLAAHLPKLQPSRAHDATAAAATIVHHVQQHFAPGQHCCRPHGLRSQGLGQPHLCLGTFTHEEQVGQTWLHCRPSTSRCDMLLRRAAEGGHILSRSSKQPSMRELRRKNESMPAKVRTAADDERVVHCIKAKLVDGCRCVC
jgi:hypothetical protein